MSQEKFAAKLDVTFPTINRWENSRAIPSPLAIEKIEGMLRSLTNSPSLALRELGKELLNRYLIEQPSRKEP